MEFISPIINELKNNIEVFKSLLVNIDPELVNWEEKEGRWTLLQIVCHITDEETEDFGTRVFHVLETPDKEMKSIDPVGWVKDHDYKGQNYEDKVHEFLQAREKSIEKLLGLTSPNWKNEYQHPKLGAMSAKMILSNWLAHDYLHIRQIVKLKFDYLRKISGEELTYAGEW